MDSTATLRVSLLVMRLTMAAFFVPWVAAKLLTPPTTQAIFATFYFVPELPLAASYALGGAQALIVLLFALGLFKLFSYGAMLLMHAASTLSTWERLITPSVEHNILFWAAVPALGAMIAL
ncbi:MAG: DoxX protein, partial [Pseudomonadota bacterium]